MLTAEDILDLGFVPGPPAGPVRHHPLAVDVDGELGAVSWAFLDMYPDIAMGWWCEATMYARGTRGWTDIAGSDDNTTSPTPFTRPDVVTNSVVDWVDWMSNDSAPSWGDGPDAVTRHVTFGIAPLRTARLTVMTPGGRERELQITPWNGAFAAVSPGDASLLTGYGHDGRVLGTLARPGDPPAW